MTVKSDVIALLDHFSGLAREARPAYALIMLCHEPDGDGNVPLPLVGMAGAVILEGAVLETAREVVGKLGSDVENRTLPPPDPALGADYVCYNCTTAPLNYDFPHWLIDAEMTRVREGAPAPLKVAFWFGRDGKTGLKTPAMAQMFENVVRPMLGLIGAVEDDSAWRGRQKEVYVLRDVVAAARAGEKVPTFHSPKGFVLNGPVTITLREADYDVDRNSNPDAWMSFAEYLRMQGERVIFVRDTARADEPLGDFVTCPAASRDIHMRMALYESAKANLFVSNGPSMLAVFGTRPWLIFMPARPDNDDYRPATVAFLRNSMGLEVGGQWPWSGPDQRIVWKPDDYANILAAWKALGL
jgi:hypothetical protein